MQQRCGAVDDVGGLAEAQWNSTYRYLELRLEKNNNSYIKIENIIALYQD